MKHNFEKAISDLCNGDFGKDLQVLEISRQKLAGFIMVTQTYEPDLLDLILFVKESRN